MQTKPCKYCKEEIAKNAKRCPKCGGKLGMPGWVKALIVIAIIFFCIIGCVSSCFNAVDEAVEKIERLATDKKLRDKLIKNGLQTAKNREWSKIEKDILDLYKEN